MFNAVYFPIVQFINNIIISGQGVTICANRKRLINYRQKLHYHNDFQRHSFIYIYVVHLQAGEMKLFSVAEAAAAAAVIQARLMMTVTRG